MGKKIRRETYTLGILTGEIRDKIIRIDADTQRLAGNSTPTMRGSLVYSVLTGKYIPPIILAEEERADGESQLWIEDGCQRCTTFVNFKFGNTKICPNIEKYIVTYKRVSKGKDGKVLQDKNGDVIYEDCEFDIRNKTYEQFPDELKKLFDKYQIDVVINQNCTKEEIAEDVRIYNDHKAMNTSQKILTYVDKFAKRIRILVDNNFFKDCTKFSDTQHKNGAYERMIIETIITMFYLDKWNRQPTKNGKFVNDNATEEQFDLIESYINRLNDIYFDGIKDILQLKNLHIWFTLFHKFAQYKLPDTEFKRFLMAFNGTLRDKEVDGITFTQLDYERHTKDKETAFAKLDFLEKLMIEYLGLDSNKISNINNDTEESVDDNGNTYNDNQDVLSFVQENVNKDTTEDDIQFYEDILDDLTLNVDNNSKLMEKANHNSLVGIVAYATEKEIDLDNWIVEFFDKTKMYLLDQKKNYDMMVEDLSVYNSKVA